MRLLVTGGNGFIGRHVVHRAIAEGHFVGNTDKCTYAADPHAHDEFLRIEHNLYASVGGDILRLNPNPIRAKGPFDVIVHLAAESHVDNSIEGDAETFARSNVDGTVRMLELARFMNIPRFIHMSTDEVGGDEDAITADSPCRPSSPYSASKAGAELLARAYRRTYGMDITIVRCGNVYGPYQHPEKLIPRAITYCLSGKPIPLYGDGKQRRVWCWIEDVAEAILNLATKGGLADVLIGSEYEESNKTVVSLISELLDGRIDHVPDRPGHDRQYNLKPNLFCKTPLTAGLAKTVTWYKQNAPWWGAAITRGGRW